MVQGLLRLMQRPGSPVNPLAVEMLVGIPMEKTTLELGYLGRLVWNHPWEIPINRPLTWHFSMACDLVVWHCLTILTQAKVTLDISNWIRHDMIDHHWSQIVSACHQKAQLPTISHWLWCIHSFRSLARRIPPHLFVVCDLYGFYISGADAALWPFEARNRWKGKIFAGLEWIRASRRLGVEDALEHSRQPGLFPSSRLAGNF